MQSRRLRAFDSLHPNSQNQLTVPKQNKTKVMKYPRIAKMCDPKHMPFDCKRMIYGRFKTIVEA